MATQDRRVIDFLRRQFPTGPDGSKNKWVYLQGCWVAEHTIAFWNSRVLVVKDTGYFPSWKSKRFDEKEVIGAER